MEKLNQWQFETRARIARREERKEMVGSFFVAAAIFVLAIAYYVIVPIVTAPIL